MRARVLKLLIAGIMGLPCGGAGCRSSDLEVYDNAAVIRRDAKVMLTPRPADAEPVVSNAR